MADGDEIEEGFDFLSTTKVLLNVKDNSLDSILLVYINMTQQVILNYCNISELPSALYFTLCQMTADVYRENNSKNNVGEVVGNVSSVSEDGRSVSFGGASDLRIQIEDKVSRTTELKRFRKLFRI